MISICLQDRAVNSGTAPSQFKVCELTTIHCNVNKGLKLGVDAVRVSIQT